MPNGAVDRIKAAFVGYFKLDPASTNTEVLAFIRAHFVDNIHDIVRAWENQEAARVTAEAPAPSGLAT